MGTESCMVAVSVGIGDDVILDPGPVALSMQQVAPGTGGSPPSLDGVQPGPQDWSTPLMDVGPVRPGSQEYMHGTDDIWATPVTEPSAADWAAAAPHYPHPPTVEPHDDEPHEWTWPSGIDHAPVPAGTVYPPIADWIAHPNPYWESHPDGPVQRGVQMNHDGRDIRIVSGRISNIHTPTNLPYRLDGLTLNGESLVSGGTVNDDYSDGGNTVFDSAVQDRQAPVYGTPTGVAYQTVTGAANPMHFSGWSVALGSGAPELFPTREDGSLVEDTTVNVVVDRGATFTTHRWWGTEFTGHHQSCVDFQAEEGARSGITSFQFGCVFIDPNFNDGGASSPDPNLSNESCAKDRQDYLDATAPGYAYPGAYPVGVPTVGVATPGRMNAVMDYYLNAPGGFVGTPRWTKGSTNEHLYFQGEAHPLEGRTALEEMDRHQNPLCLGATNTRGCRYGSGEMTFDIGTVIGFRDVKLWILDATRLAVAGQRNENERVFPMSFDPIAPVFPSLTDTVTPLSQTVNFTVRDPGYAARDGVGWATTRLTHRQSAREANPGKECSFYETQNGCVDIPPTPATPPGAWTPTSNLTAVGGPDGNDTRNFTFTVPANHEWRVEVCDRLMNCRTIQGGHITDGGDVPDIPDPCLSGTPGCPDPAQDIILVGANPSIRVASEPSITFVPWARAVSIDPIDGSTIEIIQQPARGTVTPGNGTVTYTPTWPYGEQDNTETFTFTVRDTQGNISAETLVRIDILDFAPVANNDFGIVRMEDQNADPGPGRWTYLPFMANDTDGDCAPTYPNGRGINMECPWGDIYDIDTSVIQITRNPTGRNGLPVLPGQLEWQIIYDGTKPKGEKVQIRVRVGTDAARDPLIRGFDIRYRVRDSRGIWSNEAVLDVTVRNLGPT